MLLDPGFVAAVLAGFEGTLEEVVGRLASRELSADLAWLYCKTGSTRAEFRFDRTTVWTSMEFVS
jgi:hypothetical protein